MSQKKALTPLSLRLKEAKERARLTAEEIADRLGVSPAAVRHWWTARNYPPYNVLERYAQVCGASLYWLITGKPDQEAQMGQLYQAFMLARQRWAQAVAAGVDPGQAWEAVLGQEGLLTPEQRQELQRQQEALSRYLVSVDGARWIELSGEQHAVVRDLVELLARTPH